jgi:DNA-binding NarL/FixJ family response regulator
VIPPINALTPRELIILRLLTASLTNRQIAHHLRISEKTVKNHLSAVFGKIGVANRTQAAIFALDESSQDGALQPIPSAGDLTSREAVVLDLVAAGLTNQQIADHLRISERTVKNHLSAVFGKIGVASRTQAAIYALSECVRQRPRSGSTPGRQP